MQGSKCKLATWQAGTTIHLGLLEHCISFVYKWLDGYTIVELKTITSCGQEQLMLTSCRKRKHGHDALIGKSLSEWRHDQGITDNMHQSCLLLAHIELAVDGEADMERRFGIPASHLLAIPEEDIFLGDKIDTVLHRERLPDICKITLLFLQERQQGNKLHLLIGIRGQVTDFPIAACIDAAI